MSKPDTVVDARPPDATPDPDPAATDHGGPDHAELACPLCSAAGEDAAIQPTRRGRSVAWVRRAALPLTALTAVVAVTAAAVLGWQLRQERRIDDARAAAVAAARAYGVTLTSVKADDLDSGFAAVLDGATGEFRDMYSKSSGDLRTLLQDNKASGTGTVVDAAAKSATETKVEVLLFIDQTITNAASPDPRIDRSRVDMTMELVDGRWLASRVFRP